MTLGLLVLRIVVGAVFVGHGAQKLFGSFGGHGLDGTGAFFESLGLRPGRMMARAAGLAELAGGALFALGLLTPLAATLLIAVMVTASATVHGRNGVWVTNGGFEYNLVLAAVPFAVASIGAGKWSLDHVLGLNVGGAKWGLTALVLGVIGGLASATPRPRRHGTAGATRAHA
jgi:putative oxidoreductase